MNIARVEYYFAEMLSILEMPSRDEWIIELVTSGWPDDPKMINNGKLTYLETFGISELLITMTLPSWLLIKFMIELCQLILILK